MRTLKIGENVWMVSLGGVDSNIYIIDGCLAVDAGTGKRVRELASAFREMGISFDAITSVVNTHAHFDHIGGNSLFPGASVLAHELSAKIIEQGDGESAYAHWFGSSLERRKCVGLKNKDIIKAKDTSLQIIHAPGHTDGSICLFDKKSGMLFSGDVIFNTGYGRTDLAGGSERKLKKTLEELSRINVKTILPGHGEIITGGAAHIKRTLEEIR